MLKKILIANRGEIARRIIRTARRMGVATVAVYSDADARSLHVAEADEAVHIGPAPATESYLRGDRIIAAAKATGAQGIHPGYGFLAENADFAEAVGKAGLKFIGPSPAAMRALGGKAAAKEVAIEAGVPVVPGYQGEAQDAAALAAEARKIGYPVMIKAVAGGGGRGMRLVAAETELPELLASAQREAQGAFGDPRVLIEKVVERPRHIEVQVFGDSHGTVVHLFERDCTLQRRNQKVIEEAPAPGMSEALREKMCGAAVKLAKSVGYEGAGTVEFLVEGAPSGASSGADQQPAGLGPDARWFFIEMNTRLQVEHPVTEEITGLDLVEWQLRVAAGEKLPLPQAEIRMSGHAIEARLCAEDPAKGFLPSVGEIKCLRDLTEDCRIESGVTEGAWVTPYYDSMVAKIIGTGATRAEALERTRAGITGYLIGGLTTNAAFLDQLLAHPAVKRAEFDTGFIARHLETLTEFELDPGDLEEAVCLLLCDASWHGRRADRTAPDAETPWDALDGFGLEPPRRQRVLLAVNGATRPFEIVWGLDGPCFPGARSARRPAALPLRLSGTEAQQRIFAIVNGNHVEIGWPTYDADTLDDGHAGDHIRAPINGKVARVFVSEGQTVAKGDRIAVVEAMKMEHVLHAARDGTIATVAASEGTQVNQGALIASLAEA